MQQSTLATIKREDLPCFQQGRQASAHLQKAGQYGKKSEEHMLACAKLLHDAHQKISDEEVFSQWLKVHNLGARAWAYERIKWIKNPGSRERRLKNQKDRHTGVAQAKSTVIDLNIPIPKSAFESTTSKGRRAPKTKTVEETAAYQTFSGQVVGQRKMQLIKQITRLLPTTSVTVLQRVLGILKEQSR